VKRAATTTKQIGESAKRNPSDITSGILWSGKVSEKTKKAAASETTSAAKAACHALSLKTTSAINKTATGNYVIVIKATGYGSTPMEIKVSVSADGKIIDNIAISNSETPNIGGVQLGDGKFNSNFIGKTETEAGDVDTVGSVTVTTDAYKTAILRVFTAITTIEGGAN
jgi:hypothetical protein